MNLTTIGILALGILIAYGFYLQYTPSQKRPQVPSFLWNESTGKERSIQSMNGDASMSTELIRRRTIQQNGRLDKSKLKETVTQKGSKTGAIETFMMSSLSPVYSIERPVCPTSNLLFDGGGIESDFCPILDDENGEGITYDAGGADTQVC